MSIIDMFGHLATIVQLTIVIGFTAIVFLIACSRRAAENLLLFLRGLRSIVWPKAREKWQRSSFPDQHTFPLSIDGGK